MLQLGNNSEDRFIVFSLLGNGGRARTLIFYKGAKMEDWFGVTKILEDTLIGGCKKPSLTPRSARSPSRFVVCRDLSFAKVVRGHLGGSHDS